MKQFIYNTLDVKEILRGSSKIDSCKELAEELLNQLPISANYHFNRFSNGSREVDFNDTSFIRGTFFPCLNPNRFDTYFTCTTTFKYHIEAWDLNSECKLCVTEEQKKILDTISQIKQQKVTNLLEMAHESLPKKRSI